MKLETNMRIAAAVSIAFAAVMFGFVMLVVLGGCAPAPVAPVPHCKLMNPGSELVVYLPVDPIECLRLQQRGQTGTYRTEETK
jgi:hypothetical protein